MAAGSGDYGRANDRHHAADRRSLQHGFRRADADSGRLSSEARETGNQQACAVSRAHEAVGRLFYGIRSTAPHPKRRVFLRRLGWASDAVNALIAEQPASKLTNPPNQPLPAILSQLL